jgi:hypothetical protein
MVWFCPKTPTRTLKSELSLGKIDDKAVVVIGATNCPDVLDPRILLALCGKTLGKPPMWSAFNYMTKQCLVSNHVIADVYFFTVL